MTPYAYLAEKIKGAADRGRAGLKPRQIGERLALNAIEDHENGLLEEAAADFPILKTFDLARFFSGNSMASTPYPDTFPTEAVSHVLDALRGNLDMPTLAHDAWVAGGYALSQFVGQPAATVAMGAEPLTEEDACQKVLVANAPHAGEATKAMAIPPFVWSMVWQACLSILQKLAAK